MITLICDCCRFIEDFDDGEEAFNKGWDAPPHFTGYIACNLCPGSFVVMGETYKHAPIHEKWEKEGRPNRDFDAMLDLRDEDKPDPEQFKAVQELLKKMVGNQ